MYSVECETLEYSIIYHDLPGTASFWSFLFKKGSGFERPFRPHQHWHIDVTCISVCEKFCFICCILDGYSRFMVHPAKALAG